MRKLLAIFLSCCVACALFGCSENPMSLREVDRRLEESLTVGYEFVSQDSSTNVQGYEAATYHYRDEFGREFSVVADVYKISGAPPTQQTYCDYADRWTEINYNTIAAALDNAVYWEYNTRHVEFGIHIYNEEDIPQAAEMMYAAITSVQQLPLVKESFESGSFGKIPSLGIIIPEYSPTFNFPIVDFLCEGESAPTEAHIRELIEQCYAKVINS